MIGLCLMFLMIFGGAFVFADAEVFTLDDARDIINVKYPTESYENFKVVIKKESTQYVYNLFDGDETFPLQMGSGDYLVGLYQRTEGNKYRALMTQTFTAEVDPFVVHKQSVQNMNWTLESKAVQYALSIAKQKKTDKEKFDVLYNFMIKSFVYDYKKASSVGTRYVPVIDITYKERKGICYDYSSLFASMLRSLNIPARLAEGKSTFTSVYHAWNEVYINGKWISIDTTIDAQLLARKIKYTIEKTSKDYVVAKIF